MTWKVKLVLRGDELSWHDLNNQISAERRRVKLSWLDQSSKILHVTWYGPSTVYQALILLRRRRLFFIWSTYTVHQVQTLSLLSTMHARNWITCSFIFLVFFLSPSGTSVYLMVIVSNSLFTFIGETWCTSILMVVVSNPLWVKNIMLLKN